MTAHSEITGTRVLVAPVWAMGPAARRATIREIAEDVSKRTGVSVTNILGTKKLAGFAKARREVWAIAHRSGMSYPQIADTVGRHHTTILHGVRKAQAETLETTKHFVSKSREASPAEVEETYKTISGYWSVCLGRHVPPEKVATMLALIDLAARDEAARNAEVAA